MPFRSLTDPVDLARAIAAVEEAWVEIRSTSHELLGTEEQERERLKYLVASLVPLALDEKELVARAVERFEPPRVCRRLQLLRRWSHDEQDDEQVLA